MKPVPSVQSSFKKLNPGDSNQKLCKKQMQISKLFDPVQFCFISLFSLRKKCPNTGKYLILIKQLHFNKMIQGVMKSPKKTDSVKKTRHAELSSVRYQKA